MTTMATEEGKTEILIDLSTPVTKGNHDEYSSTSEVGEFWFDDPKWDPDKAFLIREFVNELPVPFLERNKGLGRELFFFSSLICVGSIIVGHHWSLVDQNEFFASMFFASGFIPIIQLVLFEILPGQLVRVGARGHSRSRNRTQQQRRKPQQKPRGIQRDDVLSGMLAIAFLSVALALYPFPEERGDGWDIVAGKTLFEAGLIYYVTRVLFFVPNPNDEVRELKEEVRLLKQSMAIGLADGYFWNLVKEIAIDVRDANGPQNSVRLKYRQEEVYKIVKRFLVIVPTSLDWSKEDPIAEFIKAQKAVSIGQQEGGYYFKDCQIEKSAERGNSSRIKWVTDVIFHADSDVDVPVDVDGRGNIEQSSPSGTDLPAGILMDIPTTLTALFMNLKSQHRITIDSSKEEINDAEQQFRDEVNSFSYRIAWQLKKQKLDKYVAVVEVNGIDINNAGLLGDTIRDVNELFPNSS